MQILSRNCDGTHRKCKEDEITTNFLLLGAEGESAGRDDTWSSLEEGENQEPKSTFFNPPGEKNQCLLMRGSAPGKVFYR